MAPGQCALCKHALANGASSIVSVPENCSGQICENVLGLQQDRADQELRPFAAAVSLDVHSQLGLERTIPVRFRATRSTHPIPPFDALISTLRI
jgi:hypothetical protein